MNNFIQDLLRDKPPVMVLDMGLGSREQSLPAHDPEPLRANGVSAHPSLGRSLAVSPSLR